MATRCHRRRMLASTRWLALALLPTRFLRVVASNPLLTLYPAAPLTAPAAMALPVAVPRGTRKGKIPPCCQRRLRSLLRLGRTIMQNETGSNTDSVFIVSHDGTVERFPRVLFTLATRKLGSPFSTDLFGVFLLKLTNGFGGLMRCLENPREDVDGHLRPTDPSDAAIPLDSCALVEWVCRGHGHNAPLHRRVGFYRRRPRHPFRVAPRRVPDLSLGVGVDCVLATSLAEPGVVVAGAPVDVQRYNLSVGCCRDPPSPTGHPFDLRARSLEEFVP